MRKRIFAALSFAVACAASSVLHAAPFTPGNLVVYRVGDGSAALNANATAAFLDEYTSTGTLVQSVALPTTVNGANFRLVASGSAASDGFINRTVDKRFILAAGYDGAVGTASIVGTASATNPRVVARVTATGAIDTTTALTDAASATNFRSAASVDGSAFWVTGGAGTAVRYATFGASTSTQLFTTPSNFRAVGIFNGQLYVASGAGSFRMASVGSGLPTTAGQTITSLPGLPTATALYDQFFFADLDPGVAGVDTLYIADENSNPGIVKYSFDGTTWTAKGSVTGANHTGLVGVVSGTNVQLFATRNGTALVTITDTSGYNGTLTGTTTTIATNATNTAFRGITLAPEVPVTVTPSAGANGTISPSTPQGKLIGQTIQFTVTPDPTYAAVVGGTCGGTLVGTTYTTNVLTADCTVSATFTATPTFTVTPSSTGSGTISPSTPQTVNSGSTAVFTVTPAANNTVSMNGTCGGVLNMNTYTTAAITANCTVIANFSPITHAVTPSAGVNGTISPSTPQTINQGTTTTFTVTPNSGFSASVGGTCGGALVGTTYTTAVITAPCTVNATFAPLPTYTVTGSASANGSIAPTMTQTITQGNTATFTITPNAGYYAAVRGTCGGTLVGTTYTTRAITANCTVNAVFAKKVVLFVGNSYTFGRLDPVMSYNTANVTDLTLAMWLINSTNSNPDEPHPWGGIPGVFKKMTDQLGLEYDVSISARNAASLRGHYLNTNPDGWDLRNNVASQRWNAVVFQDLSDEPLPAGRAPNANLPYFNAYADKFEAWVHSGAAETYTETALFGGGDANVCATVTGATTGTCNTVRTVSPANGHASAATDVYLYQTWARPDLIAPNGTNAGGTTYSAAEGLELQTQHFADAYFGRAAGNANIKGVNPVGNAFLIAVQSGIAMRNPYVPEPGKINLWHTDYFHPSKYGSYLSALVHTAMISGIDPTTLGAAELSAADLGISSTDAVALQQVAKAAVVPPAPSIGTAIPGNGQITVSFTAGNNIGRLALTGFTATCGAQSNAGASSPIVVGGLANGVAVTCTVAASNSVGTGLASAASNSATPATSVTFTSSAPPGGTVGVVYNFTVTANGTPAPTFSVTAGALPTGLSLNGTSGAITGTPTAAGVFTGTITATNGSSSDAQNFSITIAPGAQTIAFPALVNKVLGDAPFNVTAAASSGLTVSFSSLTSGVCTSGGTNGATVTLVGAGTCTIAANQPGDASYTAAAQVSRSFNVASSAGAAVVISQVYGGGGNSGATYTNDFVELFNRSAAPVNITGWSVQYASSAGTTWGTPTSLNGTIPPGGYYLVSLATSGAIGIALPTADATGSSNMSATNGKVALVNTSTALTGSGCPAGPTIVDQIGFGTADCAEGTAAAAGSNTTALKRAANGCTDTNSNSADFAAVTPTPRNSVTPVALCSSLPGLSVSDVTQLEGNAGTTTFAFTVTLSAPAGIGGVLFDIATANGTATAGSDYVAQSLTGVTIPQGMSSYTFNVTVNGDTAPEGNETFTVNVTNVAGANVVKGTGTGTITNDDAGVDFSINDVTQNEGDSGTTIFSFVVSLSGPAPVGGVTFDIATANGTATAGSDYVAQSLTGVTIPQGMTSYTFNVAVNGDTTPELTETFFVNITNINNAIVVKSTGTGTIVNDDALRIHTVQGAGNTSPYVGQVVTVEGIVTANYQGPGTLLGYFIQEPDNLADADPATSEGIFVFTNATPASVNIGDLVRVTGTISEFGTAPNTLTEIGTPTLTPTTTVLSSGNALPAFVTVTLPVANAGDLERYEGMRVRLTQTLTVSDHFDLAHFGEITITAGGQALQATQVVDPNDSPASGTNSVGAANVAAVTAYENLNVRSSIILDGSYGTYPSTVPFLDPMTNTIRLGTTVSDVTGVLSQLGGTHRVYPDVAPVFTYAPRPLSPPMVGGNVKVASANVLNYFNGDGLGGGFPTSRGANSLVEFNRQRAKVIASISGLGADVVGILEMENDGTGPNSAVRDLVNGLNAAEGAGTWAVIADPAQYNGTNPGTTDLIRPTIVYKPAVVTPDGASTALIDNAFNNARAPVAQTFLHAASGEKFTLVVNHFKSKGSGGTGADADQGDGQGFYNNARKLQAQALVGFINALATTTPRVIAMGDFNAYAEEDPLDIFRAAGLVSLTGADASYMFDGRSGSLDHAFVNTALQAVVTGSGHWHINADEPVFLDYNVETKNHPNCTSSCTTPDYYAATPFRASDHDPVLVGLQLNAPVVQCLAGFYSATGNSPCTPADPGNYVPTPGATSQTQCSAGSFQGNSGASSCTPASAGNFVPLPGATTQTACLAGTYQPSTGATVCISADAGSFAAGPGATSQTPCLAGTYSNTSGAASCTPASVGNYVPLPGATGQIACNAGSFQASTGATSCSQATAGNFVPMPGASSQTPCAPGTYQMNGGATSCNNADAGSFAAGPGATTQTQCLAGSYSNMSGASACTPASMGSFVALPGATTQTACLAGTYQPNTGSTTCNAADAGSFVANPGASSQTPCAAGSYQGSTGQSSCTLASVGFFVANGGATIQTMCPMGSTTIVTGATSCIPVFTVTPSATANGSISPSMAQSVAQGQATSFTVTPNSGYSFTVGGNCGGTLSGNTYTTAAVTADCSVSASFAFIPVLPGAPTAVSATPGDGSAVVRFSPPAFDGGATITSYTATCGTQSATGTASPLTINGLTNFVTVSCSVIATNSIGNSPSSATVSVTPQPALALTGVVSRKTHGSSGTYDVAVDTSIAIGGAVTVESRAIGAGHTIVFQFNVPITATGTAAVVDVMSATAGSATAIQVGNNVEVTLTGVIDNQRVLVTLTGVNGNGNFEAPMGFLIGDVNNSRAVNATDIAGVKARSGQTTDATNFRFDLNASGGINATDISAVKARSGLVLP
jgi:predicted extracellular nuclease